MKTLKKYKVVNRFTNETFQTFRLYKAGLDTALALNMIANMDGKQHNPYELKGIEE